MFGLWIPAITNLVGVKQMAWFQNVSVVLKCGPTDREEALASGE
jgi:APA family basic amino acid/polyamine antiporter